MIVSMGMKFFYRTQNFRWNSVHDRTCRNILCHKGTGSDNGSFSDFHAGFNNSVITDKAAIGNEYGGNIISSIHQVTACIMSQNHRAGSKNTILPNVNQMRKHAVQVGQTDTGARSDIKLPEKFLLHPMTFEQ